MIRKARVEDASRLAEILIFAKRTAYRRIFQNDKVSFGEMQVLPLALELINTPELLDGIIVFEDDFVKGMANIKRVLVDGTTMTQVEELYIDPFFQHQGIGAELLREVENENRANKINTTFLWVLEKNAPAISFYERQGFVPTGERKPEDGTPEYLLKYIKKSQNGVSG